MTVKPNSKKLAALYEKYGIIVILILEVIFFSIKSPTFLKLDNILLVSRQVSFYGIAAVGMTMVLLVGEIDISVGSILAFSGCLSAVLIPRQPCLWHWPALSLSSSAPFSVCFPAR